MTITERELGVLSAFFPEGFELVEKTLRQRSGYSHERTQSTLTELAKLGVIAARPVGRSKLYSLTSNKECILAFIFNTFERKGIFEKKHPAESELLAEFLKETKPEVAILFGSYAKREEREGSDIDVLCIGGTNVRQTAIALERKYGFTLSLVEVEKDDFANIKKDNPPFWNDLVNFGIVLYGEVFFFGEVYEKKS